MSDAFERGSGAEDPDDPEGLLGALGERLSAQLARGTTTLRLALAEMRLAASSAAVLLGIVLVGAALAIVTWLLLAALVGYGLWRLGLSPAAVLGVLLLVHLVAALVLALLARRLAADLRFAHTRRALAGEGAPPVRPPADDRRPEPPGGTNAERRDDAETAAPPAKPRTRRPPL